MAISIGVFDAKTRLSQIVDQVINGAEFIITKHDKPVARIIPENGARKDMLVDAYEIFKVDRKKCLLNPPGLPKLNLKDMAREGIK